MDQVYVFFLADLRQLRLLEVGGKEGRRKPEGKILGAEPCAVRRVAKEQSSAEGGGLEPNRAGTDC